MRSAPILLVLFLSGCDFVSPTEPAMTRCASPAPLYAHAEHADGYIVQVRKGVDLRTTLARYEQQYGFRAVKVWDNLGSFFIDAPLRTVLALRCEPDVAFISDNAIAHPN